MTLLEALKTGRPMRRKEYAKMYRNGASIWLVLDEGGEWFEGGTYAPPPSRADLLADDWEVLP